MVPNHQIKRVLSDKVKEFNKLKSQKLLHTYDSSNISSGRSSQSPKAASRKNEILKNAENKFGFRKKDLVLKSQVEEFLPPNLTDEKIKSKIQANSRLVNFKQNRSIFETIDNQFNPYSDSKDAVNELFEQKLAKSRNHYFHSQRHFRKQRNSADLIFKEVENQFQNNNCSSPEIKNKILNLQKSNQR